MSEIELWITKTRQMTVHKAGNAQGLIDWYNNGADGQINWGTEGDFDACVAIAGKYMDNPEGFCQLRHIDATGEPTGKAPGEIAKSAMFKPETLYAHSARVQGSTGSITYDGTGFTSTGGAGSFVDVVRDRCEAYGFPTDDASVWDILGRGYTIGDEYLSWNA